MKTDFLLPHNMDTTLEPLARIGSSFFLHEDSVTLEGRQNRMATKARYANNATSSIGLNMLAR